MPRKSPLAEDLLVLTLALEEALTAEHWEEASQLFAAREAAIDRAASEQSRLTDGAREKIAVVEARIMALLNDRRAVITRGLIDQAHERKASRTYRAHRRELGFEGMG